MAALSLPNPGRRAGATAWWCAAPVGRGAGGNQPGGGTVRIGGRVPWGAEVEYAYRAGYDSRGRVSVTHVVDERVYAVMLTKPEPEGAGPGADRTSI